MDTLESPLTLSLSGKLALASLQLKTQSDRFRERMRWRREDAVAPSLLGERAGVRGSFPRASATET